MAIPTLPEEVLVHIFGYLRVQSRGYFDHSENRLKVDILLAAIGASELLARAATPALYSVLDSRLRPPEKLSIC
jgi:hypothetical protein